MTIETTYLSQILLKPLHNPKIVGTSKILSSPCLLQAFRVMIKPSIGQTLLDLFLMNLINAHTIAIFIFLNLPLRLIKLMH